MVPDDTYATLRLARILQNAGEWDAALAVLGRSSGAEADHLRAEIAVGRFWWHLDDVAPARAAIAALDPTLLQARYLDAQLAYACVLFNRDRRPDDLGVAEAGFTAAAADPDLAGWGTFRLGVLADNTLDDRALARQRYDDALKLCRPDDLLLESYVTRHLGDHAMDADREEGVLLLRRSLHLRSALGARPLIAAAQATLASELPDGPESQTLRRAAGATAHELRLTWLAQALAD
jgi:hypothetical protein